MIKSDIICIQAPSSIHSSNTTNTSNNVFESADWSSPLMDQQNQMGVSSEHNAAFMHNSAAPDNNNIATLLDAKTSPVNLPFTPSATSLDDAFSKLVNIDSIMGEFCVRVCRWHLQW